MANESGPLVVGLSGLGLGDETIGGKAAALDRVIGLGYRVPRSVVLTTDAYRRFIQDPVLAGLITSWRNASVPAPAEHERVSDAVDRAFLRAPMPDDLAVVIAQLADIVPSGATLALRSSATAEDMSSA